MNLSLIKYFFKRTFLNLGAAPLLNLLTVFTITIIMLILSVFLLMISNLDTFLGRKEENVQISIYLKDSLEIGKIKDFQKSLEKKEGVAGVHFVSKEEALKLFMGWNQKLGPLVEKTGENPFPASFELKLEPRKWDPGKIKKMALDISNVDGVGSVDYSSEWFEKLSAFARGLRAIGVFAFIFLSLATIFLVSNTIRLNVYSRRDEIGIMRLVGATDLFIKIPFLIEGILQGFLGTVGALGILYVAYQLSYRYFENSLNYLLGGSGTVFLPKEYLFFMTGLGLFVGIFGSNFAVRKFLRSEV